MDGFVYLKSSLDPGKGTGTDVKCVLPIVCRVDRTPIPG